MFRTIICASLLSSMSVIADEKNQTHPDESTVYNITVQLEWIQLPTGMLEKLILQEKDTGTKLRHAIQKQIEADKAEVIDSVVSTSRSGEQNRTTSALKYIYPTEYSPPDETYILDEDNKLTPALYQHYPFHTLHRNTPLEYFYTNYRNGSGPWSAFEERPVGTLTEFDTILDYANRKATLYIDSEQVALSHLEVFTEHKDDHGVAKIQLPQFTKRATKTSFMLNNNSYQFISQSNAIQQNGKVDTSKTVITFARAIIKPIK